MGSKGWTQDIRTSREPQTTNLASATSIRRLPNDHYERRCQEALQRSSRDRSAPESVELSQHRTADPDHRWQRCRKPTARQRDALTSLRGAIRTNTPPLGPITARSDLPSYKSRTDVSMGIHFHRRQGVNSQNSSNL